MGLKQLIITKLLFFTIFPIYAQPDTSFTSEQGIVLSPRLDSDDDFRFKVKGYGLEGGYYFLRNLGSRGMLSIEVRLAYGQTERDYKNLHERSDFFSFDTIQTLLTGTATYKNVSLALPIKYRFRLKKEGRVFLLAGFNPYFNLYNKTKLTYSLAEFNRITRMVISETTGFEEEVMQRVYARDLILLGVGFKKDRLMFDIYYSGGSTFFNHPFLAFHDKLSIVLNGYYRLN